MSIFLIIWLLSAHWIADFVLQTHEQSKAKSHSNKALLKHTTHYSVAMVVLMSFTVLLTTLGSAIGVINLVLFGIITLVCHTITDYFTSRLSSRLYKEGRIHDFFVCIGFDQLLHYVQLILTYKILFL